LSDYLDIFTSSARSSGFIDTRDYLELRIFLLSKLALVERG